MQLPKIAPSSKWDTIFFSGMISYNLGAFAMEMFFKTDESVTATQRVLQAHFMSHENDAVPERIFKLTALLIFYLEQYHFNVIWNEHKNALCLAIIDSPVLNILTHTHTHTVYISPIHDCTPKQNGKTLARWSYH